MNLQGLTLKLIQALTGPLRAYCLLVVVAAMITLGYKNGASLYQNGIGRASFIVGKWPQLLNDRERLLRDTKLWQKVLDNRLGFVLLARIAYFPPNVNNFRHC